MGFPSVMARIREIMFFFLFVFFLNGATRPRILMVPNSTYKSHLGWGKRILMIPLISSQLN
ncbi:hypothetical protein R3W88_023938 [Solanum pinnatisectum]|uniref:Uncharacterized protein n=1 Tax=Solanum pinnatisectum TaxID=50273 RepID=A0AAV9M1U5_9SOLN|nr:hypothetical protein R3W88_023938 [Solanum pinnatisectum]